MNPANTTDREAKDREASHRGTLDSKVAIAAMAGTQTIDSGVRDFVRSPFAVRRNVVKVWRSVPVDLWNGLAHPGDSPPAIRRERYSLLGVLLMAVMLLAGFSGVGYRSTADGVVRVDPLLGNPFIEADSVSQELGWFYSPGQALVWAGWVVFPSLLGWAFVRLMWIPVIASGRATRAATMTFARHLASVYFYVYLMVVVGALTMPLLISISPEGTEFYRWCFWCFLFGESFFVPAVMWIRLVVHDRAGDVFGRGRFAVLVVYMLLFVVVPIIGMTFELD